MALRGDMVVPHLANEIKLHIARECVPRVLRVKSRYVGGNRRSEYAWLFEALNGGDFTTTLSWYAMSMAQDDIVGEVREKTVLGVDLWEHQREAYPRDKYVRDAIHNTTPQAPITRGFLATIRHIEIRVLNLYHMGAQYGRTLRHPDVHSHLERYTVRLSQGSDGEVSLQGISREILNVCEALDMYAEGSPAEGAVRQHRAQTVQYLSDTIEYHLASMATLDYDLPYLIGMIVTDWNGDAPENRGELLDVAGNVMAVCGTRFDAAKVYKAAKTLSGASWDVVDDGEERE